MGYICLTCDNEYNKEALNLSNKYDTYNYLCPNLKCRDIGVVEIDDLILPIIKLLNEKGYRTKYCCSGHYYENHMPNTYISFCNHCIPQILPKGFYLEDEEWYEKNYPKYKTADSICMRKYYDKDMDEYKLHEELLYTMIELTRWAKELPIIENMEVKHEWISKENK